MTADTLQSEWARLLVGTLRRAGVRHAVISPGSRSTPFAWAALHEPELRCDILPDERSAGFFALGQSKYSAQPTLLVCTSGSAGAHYLPALVEATHSYTPLLVLTADRPFELQNSGANQTIDQLRLFGEHSRRFIELGLPDVTPAALSGLVRAAAQAVYTSSFPEPGPVQLNARARKPLEPCRATDEGGRTLQAEVDRLLDRGPTRARPARLLPDQKAVRELARRLRQARRGLLVCGPRPVSSYDARQSLGNLALELGFVVLCEAPSQLRLALPDQRLGALVSDSLELLLRSKTFRSVHRPDFVLQVGAHPTSAAFEVLLDEQPEIERHVMSDFGWPDPVVSAAASMTTGEIAALADALVAELAAQPADPETTADLTRYRTEIRRASALADRLIERELGASDALTEGGAVRVVVDAVPDGSLLAIGNSLPIREVDLFCRTRSAEVRVLSQRGASGIDGLVSGAAGAAKSSGLVTTLLLGDVSLLHDVGGLFAARGLEQPFVVVVLNNDGGRIFETLPIGRLPEAEIDAWLTPHGLDFRHAAELFGHRYERVEQSSELRRALEKAYQARGCTLVEIVVLPHSAANEQSRLRDRLEAELQASNTGGTP